MGRRHDWTLRPELMRRKAVPVGNWPTVADIPPGALVLDSDGVVKEKVGDYLIPVPVTIIGSGPLASAPVASAANQNMWYMSTDFGLCKYVSVFENAGTDWIDCGLSPYLESAVSGDSPITLELLYRPTLLGVNSAPLVWANGSGAAIDTCLSIKQRSTNVLWAQVNNVDPASGTCVLNTTDFFKVVASRCSTNYSITCNGASVVKTKSSSLISANLCIGGYFGATENSESVTALVRVYSGYTATGDVSGLTLLDEYDFNRWNVSG